MTMLGEQLADIWVMSTEYVPPAIGRFGIILNDWSMLAPACPVEYLLPGLAAVVPDAELFEPESKKLPLITVKLN